MKQILAPLIFILFSGCAAKNLIGKYASGTNNNTFEFKKDSTFINQYREGHSVKSAHGTWSKIKDDTIVLNTKIKSTIIPLNIITKEVNNTNTINVSIKLTIDNGDGLSNYLCYTYINDKVQQIRGCDSLSSLTVPKPIKSIYFVFEKNTHGNIQYTFPVTSEKIIYNVPLSSNIEVEVKFDESFFTYNAFNNEKIKLGNSEIWLFNSYLKKWESIPKVSKQVDIFVQLPGNEKENLHESDHHKQ